MTAFAATEPVYREPPVLARLFVQVFALSTQKWLLLGTWTADAVATGVLPFPEVTFQLARWWLSQ